MTRRTDFGARLTAALLMAAVCAAQSATAQEASERSAAEVAVLLAHPNSVLGTLNFNLDFTTYDGTLPGAGDQDGFTLGFQPVLPYPLKSGVNKTTILGGTPWKFAVQYWYYVKSPDAFGRNRQIRLAITPVIPLPWGK